MLKLVKPVYSANVSQNCFISNNRKTSTNPQIADKSLKNEQKVFLSSTKYLVGDGLIAFGAEGRYIASKGDSKLSPEGNATINEKIKEVSLPESLELRQFENKKEAIAYLKDTFKINEIDEKIPLEALNDVISAITKVSNKQKGKLFVPSKLAINSIESNIAGVSDLFSHTPGALSINENMYKTSFFDNSLEQMLYFSSNAPCFRIENGECVCAHMLDNILFNPESYLCHLLEKYYNKENLTLNEKQILFLSFEQVYDFADKVKTAPFAVFKELKANERFPLIEKQFYGKSISEQSEIMQFVLRIRKKQGNPFRKSIDRVTIENILLHELGHIQDLGKNKEKLQNWYYGMFRNYTKSDFEKNFPGLQITLPPFMTNPIEQNIAGEVSGYATKCVGEFIAEVYAGLIQGKQYSDDVMTLYSLYDGPMLIDA